MRLWVDPEYAEELAVVAAWLVALVPWNVTFSTIPDVGSLLFVRFPLGQVRYAFGLPVARAVRIDDAYSAWQFQAGQSIAAAYGVWVAGAALVLLALALTVAMYADLAAVAPYRPVQAMGGLLLVAGVVFSAATYLLWARGLPGVPIPVGVPFALAFGFTLVRTGRAE